MGALALSLAGALALGGAPAVAGTTDEGAAFTRITWSSPDVVPSSTPGVTALAAVQVGSDLELSDAPPAATFVLRTAGGALVETREVRATCPTSIAGNVCWGDDDEDSEYAWTWNGRRPGGALLPAGRYVLSATVPDGAGGTVTRVVGSTWIRHLATVRGIRRWTPTRQTSYARVGRCSAVAVPGRWPGSIGVRSLTRCRSTAGTDDLAAQTFRLVLDGSLVERVTAWRLDAYGAPARSGMTASLLGHTPGGWQRSAVLGDGLRWHLGSLRRTALGTWSSTNGRDRRLVVQARARATNGNRYDVKLLRTVITYRAWVR